MKELVNRKFEKFSLSLGLAILVALCATVLVAAQEDLPPYAGDIPLDLKDVSDYETVVYINPDTTIVGDGSSPESPLLTWDGINPQANTAYVQKRGTACTLTGEIVTFAEDENAFFGAYGDENDPRPVIYGEHTGHVINIGASGVTVRDLELVSSQATSGIALSANTVPTDTVVWNCYVHGIDQDNYMMWGIRVFGSRTKVFHTEIAFTGDDGMYIKDSQMVEIAYNTIHHVNQKWFEDPSETYSGGDGVQFSTDVPGFYIHHNYVDRTDTGNKFCFIVKTTRVDTFGLIEYNTCLSTSNQHGIYASSSESGYHLIIRNNFLKYTAGEGQEGSAIYNHADYPEIYNNVFVNYPRALNLLSPTVLAEVHHNTFYGGSSGTYVIRNPRPVEAYNNIFVTGESMGAFENTTVSITASHNLYAFASQVVGDNAIVGDPLFVDPDQDDFRLQASSPAVDAGTSLAGIPTDAVDYPRDASPDLGAYEFQADLDLSAATADDGVQLTWTVNVTLPVTSTWRISYRAVDSTIVLVATETLSNPARSYLLTGLQPGAWYTVTLDAMLDDAVLLSDSERVIYYEANVKVYLPLVLKSPSGVARIARE